MCRATAQKLEGGDVSDLHGFSKPELDFQMGHDQVLHFRLAIMKKKEGMWCEWRGVGHTFMGGWTHIHGGGWTHTHGGHWSHWFGSQEVPRVLEFLPSGPESPFYFKAVIRDMAKNVYTGYSLHII